ncbi:Gfo/Idh/MocA family protein, partial [Escherichia coli]|uniref:Gfo/Idh/MocA family protein n=1 Tax=Escherichia coli TaxID=562 RepID=UPI001BC88A9F
MSNKTIKVALAGAGAFGIKHLDGIKNIDGVEVVSLVGRELAKTQEVTDKYGIQHVTTELADSLALPEVDAVILCTPTQMHAAQAIECLKAGKHVQVEIPLADSLKDAPGRGRSAKADRPGGHVRPHAPLQPQPPVGAQEDRGRRVQHPADGCADL